jgi:hypothetical protein
MRIKKGAPCDIPVHVSDAAGKPSPSTKLAFAYSDYPHFWIDQETDANGKGEVYSVFPGPVFLKAVIPNEGGSSLESEVVEVNSCPAEPVLLKLSHRVVYPQKPQGN